MNISVEERSPYKIRKSDSRNVDHREISEIIRPSGENNIPIDSDFRNPTKLSSHCCHGFRYRIDE